MKLEFILDKNIYILQNVDKIISKNSLRHFFYPEINHASAMFVQIIRKTSVWPRFNRKNLKRDLPSLPTLPLLSTL